MPNRIRIRADSESRFYTSGNILLKDWVDWPRVLEARRSVMGSTPTRRLSTIFRVAPSCETALLYSSVH